MSLHNKLRNSSIAARALVMLSSMGGSVSPDVLRVSVSDNFKSQYKFRVQVIEQLEAHHYAHMKDGLFCMTALGKAFVSELDVGLRDVGAPYIGQIALPRIARPWKTLTTVNAAPYRPGSDEHLQIPSLMGCVRKLPNGDIVE